MLDPVGLCALVLAAPGETGNHTSQRKDYSRVLSLWKLLRKLAGWFLETSLQLANVSQRRDNCVCVLPLWDRSCRSSLLSHWPCHSILTPGQTVLALNRQAPGRVAAVVPILKSLVWLDRWKPDLIPCFRSHLSLKDRLVGLVVRLPPLEWKIPNPAYDGIFSGSSHTSDFKIGTPVATLPGAWRYRVSAGTGQPGVSILWLGEMESLVCNFYLSVAALKIVWADPSLRYTSMLLGR